MNIPDEPCRVEAAAGTGPADRWHHAEYSPATSERAEPCPGTAAALSGQKDHTIPDAVTHSTFSQHRHSTAVTDLMRLAGQPVHDHVTGPHRRPARQGKAAALTPRITPGPCRRIPELTRPEADLDMPPGSEASLGEADLTDADMHFNPVSSDIALTSS